MRMLWKGTALLGLLLAACLVPTFDEFNQENARLCDAANLCLPGYACVEGHCQPEEGTECRPGTSVACGKDKGECKPGTRTCGEDGRYGPCTGPVLPKDELCNGLDDNCDGAADEGLSCGVSCEECTTKGRTCVQGGCGEACVNSHYKEGDQCLPKKGLGTTCSENRVCESGFCVDGSCCSTSACTTPQGQCIAATGTCATGTCQYAPLPNTTACDDGKACTLNDKCDGSGKCASGTPMPCTTPPTPCYASTGTCSGVTDRCEYAPLPNTTACDDGNKCTESDRCNGAGQCVSGNAKLCDQPDQCHESAGSCKTTTGECVYPVKPTGTLCDDGNGCTGDDSCESGFCRGTYLCSSREVCNGNQCVCDAPQGSFCPTE